MNRSATLAPGFEHLSYLFGKTEAKDGFEFAENKARFVLRKAESRTQAEMILGCSDFLSTHSSESIGYVEGSTGEIFVVCKDSGEPFSKKAPKSMPDEERFSIAVSAVRRLASLHSQGFGCGGVSPGALNFSGEEAFISDPTKIFALIESDSAYYEAVATLRALAGAHLAKKSDLPRLASEYFSFSPVCRHAIVSHLASKGVKKKPHIALADAALRYLSIV